MDLINGVSVSEVDVRLAIALSSLIIKTTSCLSFGARRVSAVDSDIPHETRWNLSVDVLRGTPLIEISLRRNRVFRKCLRMCFQSKSDVISSAPHRVLKKSNKERASYSRLDG